MINGPRTKSTRGRRPRDLYETPQELADAAICRLRLDKEFPIASSIECLDAGCGNGVWGRPLAKLVSLTGIDLSPNVVHKEDYNDIITGDFLKFISPIQFHLVYGNPPYSLAEEFIQHAFEMLTYDGRVFFLLRLSFLEGIKRCRGLFKDYPLKRVYVCSRRPSFFSSTGKRHTTDTLAYALFLWQKGYPGKTQLSFLDWKYK